MSAERRRRLRRTVGQALVLAAMVPLGSVAYQVFGTSAVAEHAQADLRRELPPPVCPLKPVPSYAVNRAGGGSPGGVRPPVRPALGGALALLRIDRAGVDDVVVEGARPADLKRGPGHLESSVLPGQPGVFAISGHRTTYSAPFYRLDRVRAGDRITVTTRTAVYGYRVTATKVVQPADTSVLRDNARGSRRPASIVIITCTPAFSDAQRLVVLGRLTEASACTT